MHQGRLTKQFCQVNFTKSAFVAAIIPCSPFGKDMMSHVAKVLFDRRTEVVSQHHRFKRSEVASPPVQSEEHAFEDEFTASDNPDERKYRQACQVVFENQKASGSWLQRQMGVGYNTAAKWIERMESEGLVGPANHVGRRDVYRDKDGNPL